MKSPIPYFGGKSRVANKIISKIPPHKTFCEVFGGAAWVSFKKQPSNFEVLNDLDGNLINFWKMFKHHPEALAIELKKLIPSRQLFNELKEQIKNSYITEIQKAAYYYYLQRQSFAGVVKYRSFSMGKNKSAFFQLKNFYKIMDKVSERLSKVTIECVGYEKIIQLYDTKNTFFFLDPPYLLGDEYQYNFSEKQMIELATNLKTVKGKFLLTHKKDEKILDIFNGFHVLEKEVNYSTGTINKTNEFFITNYQIDKKIKEETLFC